MERNMECIQLECVYMYVDLLLSLRPEEQCGLSGELHGEVNDTWSRKLDNTNNTGTMSCPVLARISCDCGEKSTRMARKLQAHSRPFLRITIIPRSTFYMYQE